MNRRNILRNYGYLSVLFMLVLVSVIGITASLGVAQKAAPVKTAAPPVETLDVTVDDAVGVLHVDLTKFRFDLLKTLTAKTKTMKLKKAQINTILKCATLINSVDILFLLDRRGFPEPIAIIRGKITPQDVIDLITVFAPRTPPPTLKLQPLANGRYKFGDAMFIYGKQAADVPDGMLIISSPKMQGVKMLSSIAQMTSLPQPATTHKPDTTKPIWGAMCFTTTSRGNGQEETFDISGSGDPSGKGSGTITARYSPEDIATVMVEGFSKAKAKGQPFLECLEMVADGETVKITIAGKENFIAEAIDALFEAREKAKRAVSMSNARNICLAVHLYAVDNNDNLPKKFEKLTESNIVEPRILVSPVSGKKPPKWDDKKKTLTGDVDYVLVDYGKLSVAVLDQPAEMILIYEKPENYKNKATVVGYADGHVMWVKIEEFDKQLKKTKDWIKENSK